MDKLAAVPLHVQELVFRYKSARKILGSLRIRFYLLISEGRARGRVWRLGKLAESALPFCAGHTARPSGTPVSYSSRIPEVPQILLVVEPAPSSSLVLHPWLASESL